MENRDIQNQNSLPLFLNKKTVLCLLGYFGRFHDLNIS